MCSTDRDELVWTIRRQDGGDLVTSRDGLAYYFAEEEDAVELRRRLGLDGVAEVISIRAARDLA